MRKLSHLPLLIFASSLEPFDTDCISSIYSLPNFVLVSTTLSLNSSPFVLRAEHGQNSLYMRTQQLSPSPRPEPRAIRREYVRSLLRQDISYFDICTPGSVSTSVSNNADMIHTGLAEKVGTIIQGLAMLTAAFIVAFATNWNLTLVTATTLPGAVIGVGITIALDARLEAKILDIYAKAGGLVEEALGSIRIVTAFGADYKLLKKYEAYLEVAKTLA